VVLCAGALWHCYESIPKTSRPLRYGPGSAQTEAWRIRAWGCCAMGWGNAWGGADMWRLSPHEPTDPKACAKAVQFWYRLHLYHRGARYGSRTQNLTYHPPHARRTSDAACLTVGDHYPGWTGQTGSDYLIAR
jgi:hypothetical protein